MKNGNWLSVFALLGGLMFGSTVSGAPLDNWSWRNPLPNGNPQAGPHTLNGVVFANGKFVAVGASGVVSISTDSTNWIEGATATTNNLNGILFADSQFVAVGDGGAIETSTDGTNWLLQASGTTNSLRVAAYANGKFVAAGSKVVLTSTDAQNWLPAASGIGGASGLVGGSAGFVAIGGNQVHSTTNNLVYFSANGSTWTSQGLTAPGSSFGGNTLQNAIVTYANGAYLIGSYRYATSMSADTFIFRSNDGSFWTTNVLGNVSTGTFGFAFDMFMTGNDTIMAHASTLTPYLLLSADGINWSKINNVPDTIPNSGFKTAGVGGNGTFVILGVASPVMGLNLPPIYTSTDGLTWTNRQQAPQPPTGQTNIFTSIAFSNGVYVVATSSTFVRSTNGLVYSTVSNSPALTAVTTYSNNFVGVGSNGTVYISGDGLSWTQRNSGTLNNLRGIASGGGLLVAVGDTGAIQTSPIGTIWTSRSSGTTLNLYGVAYSNGLFVAVGYLGTVLTSADGVSWTGQDSGQLTNLLSVTFGSAGFAAVGPGGTILTSTDGVSWTKQNSGTVATLESIAFGNGYYLAAGDNATALTSPDGITWTPRNLGVSGGQNFYGSAFLNGRFDVVGSNGTILESAPVAPLFDVQIHPDGNWITAFAPQGSSFRIQTCTNLAAPVWVDAKLVNNASAITQWTNTSGLNPLFYRAISP